VVNDLVDNFVKARGPGDYRLADDSGLFDALDELGRDRNIGALLAAFHLTTSFAFWPRNFCISSLTTSETLMAAILRAAI
jgi:hypothetical protein